MQELRIYPRYQLKNMSVDISDGHGFYSGFIGDISKTGLRLQHISSELKNGSDRLTVIVAKDDATFRFIVSPRWESQDGFTKDVGVRIVGSTPEWKEYVDSFSAN